MIIEKENITEKLVAELALKKRLVELEELLVNSKKKLAHETAYNKQLEIILREEHPAKRSKFITIRACS